MGEKISLPCQTVYNFNWEFKKAVEAPADATGIEKEIRRMLNMKNKFQGAQNLQAGSGQNRGIFNRRSGKRHQEI